MEVYNTEQYVVFTFNLPYILWMDHIWPIQESHIRSIYDISYMADMMQYHTWFIYGSTTWSIYGSYMVIRELTVGELTSHHLYASTRRSNTQTFHNEIIYKITQTLVIVIHFKYNITTSEKLRLITTYYKTTLQPVRKSLYKYNYPCKNIIICKISGTNKMEIEKNLNKNFKKNVDYAILFNSNKIKLFHKQLHITLLWKCLTFFCYKLKTSTFADFFSHSEKCKPKFKSWIWA